MDTFDMINIVGPFIMLIILVAIFICLRKIEVDSKADAKKVIVKIKEELDEEDYYMIPEKRFMESWLHYLGRLLNTWSIVLISRYGSTIMSDGRTFEQHIKEMRHVC